jgi:hypothetical protein
MQKLSKQQQDKLRWETGPYSEVSIKIEDRLLDNYSSRQFVSVYTNINPLTYEIAKQNIASFDDRIQELLMTAQFEWQKHWYVVYSFKEQVDYENINDILPVLKRAQRAKQIMTIDVINLHYFVMDLLDIEYKKV